MFVVRLETQKLLRRAQDTIALGNAGSKQHPYNAGPGLVASGGMGAEKREQFLADYPELVRLATIGAAHDPYPPRPLFGDPDAA